MRSISFGPTSYLEDSRQYSRQSEEEDDGQNTHISNESVGNSYSSSSRGVNEVIFYASENLFREGFTSAGGSGSHHRELAMKKHCKCKFAFDSSRTFQSYCYEFCGLLNIRLNDVRFYLGNREAPFSRTVRKPCIIEVQSGHGSSANSGRSSTTGCQQQSSNTNVANGTIQSATRELLEKGLYSDIDIVVNNDTTQVIKAHKAILMARSEKFRGMLESQMRESTLSKIEIEEADLDATTYRLLIQWMYEGECDMNGCTIDQMLILLKLTDEYLLLDLQKICEDTIIDTIDGPSALHILTDSKILIPANSDQTIKDAAKSVLLDEYEQVEKTIPDIEERISKVKGLMSDLFTHKLKKKKGGNSQRGRNKKGTIVIDEGGSKKKVRFNISSTIYEEASAIIHDESDSMIEPLSIYSNSSPPGELINDEMLGAASSTRSLSMPTVSERRHSEGVLLSSHHLNTSINATSGGRDNIEEADVPISNAELGVQESSQSPRVRFNLRNSSTGRPDPNFSSHNQLRRASSYRLEIQNSNTNHSAGASQDGPTSHHNQNVGSVMQGPRSQRGIGGHSTSSLL